MTNTQIVQAVYAAFKRRDVPAVLDALTPDVSWGMLGRQQDLAIAGIRHGKAGAGEFFRTMAEMLDVLEFEPQTFLEAADKVFVWGRWKWRMRHNGAGGENEWLQVFTLRDGKVSEWRGHNDTAQLARAYAAPAVAKAANG